MPSQVVDGEVRRLAREAGEAFLRDRYDDYLVLVGRVERAPENRSGADKTWVQLASHRWRRHVRSAVRSA